MVSEELASSNIVMLPPGACQKFLDNSEADEENLAKKPRLERARAPIANDVLHHGLRHQTELLDDVTFLNIREAWPKTADEYPKGFSTSNPPGFCTASCNCMDDKRPQKAWERHKAWLEDASRSSAAQSAVDAFAVQKSFVKTRGQVTKRYHFEADSNKFAEFAHTRSALCLSLALAKALRAVLEDIPVKELRCEWPVHIAGLAYLTKGNADYKPLAYKLVDGPSGEKPPPWLCLDSETGQLSIADQHVVKEDAIFQVELRTVDSILATATCRVHPNPGMSWNKHTNNILGMFLDASSCGLSAEIRAVLTEHFSRIYDFSTHRAKEVRLGCWVDACARVLRLSRTAAVRRSVVEVVPAD